MVMRHWMDCPIVVTHGRLREWQIFTKRNGGTPNADTGEVTFFINCYSRAVVPGGVTTEPTTHEGEVELFYMCNGQGIVRIPGEEREICDGSSFAIPAGMEHRIANTGKEDLEFILARREPASDGSDDGFAVRHWTEDREPSQFGSPFQGHWNHIYRGPEAGLHMGDLPPRKFSHPHNHMPGFDEIWYVHSGCGWHWMGREYRKQTAGYALWLEPGELHSLMNIGDENVEYIYCSSAKMLMDKARLEPEPPEEKPETPSEILKALEEKFSALVEAYQRTGVSIHGVGANIGPIREYIVALQEKF